MTREKRKKSKFSTPKIDIALMLCTHTKPCCHSATNQTEWISRSLANTSFSVVVKLMYTLGQPISLAKISCLLCLHIPLSHSSLYNYTVPQIKIEADSTAFNLSRYYDACALWTSSSHQSLVKIYYCYYNRNNDGISTTRIFRTSAPFRNWNLLPHISYIDMFLA